MSPQDSSRPANLTFETCTAVVGSDRTPALPAIRIRFLRFLGVSTPNPRHPQPRTAATMKTSTAITTAGATIATGMLAYVIYFDYTRRNYAAFRKKLRKPGSCISEAHFRPCCVIRVIIGEDNKKVEESEGQLEVDDATATTPTTERSRRTTLLSLRRETLTLPSQEKAYFTTQVTLGEQTDPCHDGAEAESAWRITQV